MCGFLGKSSAVLSQLRRLLRLQISLNDGTFTVTVVTTTTPNLPVLVTQPELTQQALATAVVLSNKQHWTERYGTPRLCVEQPFLVKNQTNNANTN